MKNPCGRSFIVDSEDPEHWAEAIKGVRQKGSEAAIKECRELRTRYAKKYSWETQSTSLVRMMLTKVHGQLSKYSLERDDVEQIKKDNSARTSHCSQPEEATRPKEMISPSRSNVSSSNPAKNSSKEGELERISGARSSPGLFPFGNQITDKEPPKVTREYQPLASLKRQQDTLPNETFRKGNNLHL